MALIEPSFTSRPLLETRFGNVSFRCKIGADDVDDDDDGDDDDDNGDDDDDDDVSATFHESSNPG